jgi:hypothetical protein
MLFKLWCRCVMLAQSNAAIVFASLYNYWISHSCLQVYQEPLCRRHHSSIWSAAAVFRVVSLVLAVVLSFLLAYATDGFWKKVGQDVIQPTVHYSGDGLLILEVRNCAVVEHAVWWYSNCCSKHGRQRTTCFSAPCRVRYRGRNKCGPHRQH